MDLSRLASQVVEALGAPGVHWERAPRRKRRCGAQTFQTACSLACESALPRVALVKSFTQQFTRCCRERCCRRCKLAWRFVGGAQGSCRPLAVSLAMAILYAARALQ